ncbi:MAG TPA: sigma-54-dependent Fis family transcriptional regulator [Dongiaceae bacterium]|jgi:transcriptional regulator of acetoin/glycerol metabolism|nr:sigma-54-dependent Fis family transcriptional regulator [Dongiaceae bacterium]
MTHRGRDLIETFRGGPEPSAGLAQLDEVSRSRTRCLERYGLSPDDKPHLGVLTGREVVDLNEPFGRHIPTIRRELEFMYASLRSASFCASFSDMTGIILQDQGINSADANLDLERAGAIWAEGIAGTNGVGTAAMEKSPVIVAGAQHFFRAFSSLSCIAAPVLSADTDMVGVLNLTTANPNVTVETLALAADLALNTAERLSNQFFMLDFASSTMLRISDSGKILLLAFDDDQQIVGANLGAREKFNWSPRNKSADLWGFFDRDPRIVDDLARGDSLNGLRTLAGERLDDAEILRPPSKRRDWATAIAPSPAGKVRAGRPGAEKAEPTVEQCLGPDPRMQQQTQLLQRVAGSSLPILLLGETGVGKDTLATALHRESPRAGKPFVVFNCAAVQESLIDSELFGYGAGAFTGAKREGNVGRIQQADGGTLFLDEIGDMPLPLQTRLLRVLETGEVSPLGSARTTYVDIHVIAATNADLKDALAEGRFRQDLFYRLAGIVVELQPLRERADKADIAARLLRIDAQDATLSDDALRTIEEYRWPGNIREMKFVLKRAARLSANGLITAKDLLLPVDLPAAPPPLPAAETGPDDPLQAVAETERKVLLDVLARHSGNVGAAAAALNMSRATLYRKIRQHNVESMRILR